MVLFVNKGFFMLPNAKVIKKNMYNGKFYVFLQSVIFY